jgi:hypothetical protein
MAITLLGFLGGNRGKNMKNPVYSGAEYQYQHKLLYKGIVFYKLISV